MKILILAGGSGSRLWPLSRVQYPKQFLPLSSSYSLIQETAARVSAYPVFVVTAKETAFLAQHHLSQVLPKFLESQVFQEPCARNTAPAIAWASSFFDDEDVLAVLPSDQTIAKPEIFQDLLKQAQVLAKQGQIVTFGITPHRPETGYGYIKITNKTKNKAYFVEAFKEKPNLATAQTYLKEGGYFWNSGIFVFKVQTLKEELQIYAPQIYETMVKLAKKQAAPQEYQEFLDISIDYAVMEKTKKMVLLKADMGWNDLGGFEALYEQMPKDLKHNVAKGKVLLSTLKAHNNLVFSMASDSKRVALIGVENLVVADTDDALLICKQEDSQEVKKVFETLKTEKAEEAFLHKKVFRPWGYYVSVREEPGFKIKEIVVYPKQRLSLQAHQRRSESWTVVEGVAIVSLEDQDLTLLTGQNILVPLRAKHRLANPSDTNLLKIVEVQMGDYLGEDDIIRYQDDYHREE